MIIVPTVTLYNVSGHQAFVAPKGFFGGSRIDITEHRLDEYLYGREEPAATEGKLCIKQFSRMREVVYLPVSEIPITPLSHFREFFYHQNLAQDTRHTVKALVMGRHGKPIILAASLSFNDEDMGGWYYDWTICADPIGDDQNITVCGDTKIVCPSPS